MKIGLFVQRFSGGGAEKYVQEIAQRLYDSGKDVVIVTSENNSDDSEYDFRIIRLPSTIKIGEYFVWRRLEDVLKKEQFDIIHTNTYGYYHSDKVARLKKKYGYKLVMTSHGFTGMDIHKLKKERIISHSLPLGFLRDIYDEKIGKKTLLECDHLIALSQYDYDFYKEIGVDESKISIIPPGVADVFFEPSYTKLNLEGYPILLSVGTLNWIKNQKMMIEAMPCVIKRKPDVHLYLVGPDGGELKNLQRQCRKLGIQKNVSFVGKKTSSEVRDYMRSSDLLLHTSYAEGLSTILLESLVSGLPFITTVTGGNSYLANLGVGMKIRFHGDEQLSQRIIELLDNPNKLETMKNIAIRKATDFAWTKIFLNILDTYANLI